MSRFSSALRAWIAAAFVAAFAFGSLLPGRADPVDTIFTLPATGIVPADCHERPVFLLVVAPASRVSRRFEREVLAVAKVRALLSAEFVCARVEFPLPDGLARRYRVEKTPAFVFLDRFGARLRTVEGERSVESFLDLLRAQLPELAEQAAETEQALRLDSDDAAELARRARTLVDQALEERAVRHFERIAELDPRDEQYSGHWAMAERARVAYRSGDWEAGDRWSERVSGLEAGREPLYAEDLLRERLAALRAAGRVEEAVATLARLREGDRSDEELRTLDLEEARLLRAAGREAEAVARFHDLWDSDDPAARAAAEEELERWAHSAGAAADSWRALRDGRELVQRFQCGECHPIEPAVAVDIPASCVGCHQRIRATANHPKEFAEALRADPEWYSHVRNIRHYLYAPHLATAGARLRRDWLRAFLRHPVDVRPYLTESMPRLPLTDADIDVALDYFEALAARRLGSLPRERLPEGNLRRGEELFVERGCSACHLFGNRRFPEGPAPEPWPRDVAENVRNAPNLRWVRDRVRPETLALWIRQPSRFVPGTLMPATPLSDQDCADVIAFLLGGDPGEPAPIPPAPTAADLPPARSGPVRFEHAADIFLDTCKHCHLPDAEGGIGNLGGGWGYSPRGLDLATPTGPLRGSFAAGGRRRSILAAPPGGDLPPLLQRLLWRIEENRFDAWPPYRDPLLPVPLDRYEHPPGMPLGLPSLAPEELATLRAWLAGLGRAPEERR